MTAEIICHRCRDVCENEKARQLALSFRGCFVGQGMYGSVYAI